MRLAEDNLLSLHHDLRVEERMARILIIDDNAQLREMLNLMLTQAGHEVTEAGSGTMGLNLFRATPADLVVVDILMPEKGGLETIVELKRDFPNAKIIGISGGFQKKTDETHTLAELLGVERTLSKPFATDELLKAVREILSK
jgi:DNA-binding response OmpR family regulator